MSSGSNTRAPSEAPAAAPEPGQKVNWELVNQALRSLDALDIVEMADHVVTQARIKGAKEAFNEAGSVRYQLAKVRQQVAYLQKTICSEDLEAQHEQIKNLTRVNAEKRVLTGRADPDAMYDD